MRAEVDRIIREQKPDVYFVTHQGDFLSPSPLSNFDKGANMVKIMNAMKFTHICIGNHEFDHSLGDVRKRLNELKTAKILAANINFPYPEDYVELKHMRKTPLELYNCVEHDISELPNGLKLGWVGVCTEETIAFIKSGGLYSKYEGLTMSDSIKTAKKVMQRLKAEGCNYIIPLTHLNIGEDRQFAKMAKEFGVKVVLGGHDHDEYFEDENGVKIIKAGIDARKMTVTTITFPPNEQTPEVRSELVRISGVNVPEGYSYITKICDEGAAQLDKLGGALLIRPAPMGEPVLSSVDPRNRQCTVGQLFADKAKRYFRTDCCLLNSGKIRNNSEYPKGLTLVDIGSELPFKDNFMYTTQITGAELEETLKYSWAKLKGTGGFITHDSKIIYDDIAQRLVCVAGAPANSRATYSVTIPISLLNGMDHIAPLEAIGDRTNTKSIRVDALPLLQDIVTKVCVVERWAEFQVRLKDFEEADKNRDGVLTIQVLKRVSFSRKSNNATSQYFQRSSKNGS
uniref:EF-hand domain-containing protein n=1 Tax=Lotharella globosa TaxID=91324 RepID=A0A7S4DJD4_9EUKA